MNATRCCRLILKVPEELGIIQKFAIQHLERYRAISRPHLLGEKDRTDASFAQASDNAKTAGQSSGKLRLGFRGLGGEASAVTWTEGKIVRVSFLACGADFHQRL